MGSRRRIPRVVSQLLLHKIFVASPAAATSAVTRLADTEWAMLGCSASGQPKHHRAVCHCALRSPAVLQLKCASQRHRASNRRWRSRLILCCLQTQHSAQPHTHSHAYLSAVIKGHGGLMPDASAPPWAQSEKDREKRRLKVHRSVPE
jgi:hypothetical protein